MLPLDEIKGWNSVSEQVADYLKRQEEKEIKLLNEKDFYSKEQIRKEILADKRKTSEKIFDSLNLKGTLKVNAGIVEVGLEAELTNLQIQNIPSYFKK